MTKLFPSLPRNDWVIPDTSFIPQQLPQNQVTLLDREDSTGYSESQNSQYHPVPLFNRNLLNFVLANRLMSGMSQQNFAQNQQNMQRIQGFQQFDNSQNLGSFAAPYTQQTVPFGSDATNYGQGYPFDNFWQINEGQDFKTRPFPNAKPEHVQEVSSPPAPEDSSFTSPPLTSQSSCSTSSPDDGFKSKDNGNATIRLFILTRFSHKYNIFTFSLLKRVLTIH